MLDDCKNPEPVRGFFNEYLNSELTPHRKVFEVLADKMKTPYQEHQLSGLGSHLLCVIPLLLKWTEHLVEL